jgi:hypothetical protein
MSFFTLTTLRLGLFCIYFLMTLLACSFSASQTYIGILGMKGLKTLSILKAKNLLRVTLTSSSGS